MRYGGASPGSKLGLTRSVATPPLVAALVTATSCAELVSARQVPAFGAAVALASVAGPADVERLAAARAVRPAVAVFVSSPDCDSGHEGLDERHSSGETPGGSRLRDSGRSGGLVL